MMRGKPPATQIQNCPVLLDICDIPRQISNVCGSTYTYFVDKYVRCSSFLFSILTRSASFLFARCFSAAANGDTK